MCADHAEMENDQEKVDVLSQYKLRTVHFELGSIKITKFRGIKNNFFCTGLIYLCFVNNNFSGYCHCDLSIKTLSLMSAHIS